MDKEKRQKGQTNYLQNTTQKTTDWGTRTQLVNSGDLNVHCMQSF